jgi:hypothetical protein
VAPGDGALDGALPGRKVYRPGAQHARPETGEDLIHREQSEPGRHQLDGQREAIEPTDQLGHEWGILGRELEVGSNRHRPIREEPDRLGLHQPAEVAPAFQPGDVEGWNGELLLTADPEGGS